MDLLSNAEKLAIKLADEKKAKELKENIKRIGYKKLECVPSDLLKRSNSFKGRNKDFLMGFEQEKWKDEVQ